MFPAFFFGSIVGLWHMIFVAFVVRGAKKIAPILTHTVSALIGLLLLWLLSQLLSFNFWLSFSMLALMVSSYLFLFGAVYKSLSLRLLCAIVRQGEPLTLQVLETNIIASTYMDRVRLLSQTGNVIVCEKHYMLSKRGKTMVSMLSLMRRVLHISTKALYYKH